MAHKFNMNKPANFQVSIPLDHDVSVPEYLAVVKRDIPRWAQEYVDHVDTATTEEICKCTWDCHPDDLKIRPLHCRDCEHPRDKHDDNGCNDNEGNCICVHYSPRRVKLGDHNSACPVHSPVGRIMGFFEYIFTQQDNAQKIEVEDKEAVISEFENQALQLIPPSVMELTEEEATEWVDKFKEAYPNVIDPIAGNMTGEPKGFLNEDTETN